jgi:Ni,Fe-hydrogenase III large subunit
MRNLFLPLINGQSQSLNDIPVMSLSELRESVCNKTHRGQRLLALFILLRDNKNHLCAIIADDENSTLSVASAPIGNFYPAFTSDCSQAYLFEQEIYEKYGIMAEGHPCLKPVRYPLDSHHKDKIIGTRDFYHPEGPGIHEVAVGPVHAGIIEPGHFRFQCQGEKILSLEISRGYQNRGVEKAILQSSEQRRNHLIETVSGDATAAHSLAFNRTIEAFCKTSLPARAKLIRGIALELERCACHIGDLGAIAGDIGYQPTSARCGWIRGNALNLTAELCGNRFSRGIFIPGGVKIDIDTATAKNMTLRLKAIRHDVKEALAFFWETPSVLARIEGTGIVTTEEAQSLGMVGPAARASGIATDVRCCYPEGIYRFQQIPIAVEKRGDVYSRARIRWTELNRSLNFIEEALSSLPNSALLSPLEKPQPNAFALALSEGWRGETAYIATTDKNGELNFIKIIDPSFKNWEAVSLSVKGEGISDFPLCNKSFNLSYCGHDL